MKLLALLTTLLPLTALAADPAPTSFIRVDEDEAAARLQTAVTRYEKDGTSVELIGAVHIADRGYYEKLNERFGGYDALLYEMIGGGAGKPAAAEGPAPEADAAPPEGPDAEESAKAAKAAAAKTEGLRAIYATVAQMLKLEDQIAVVDYSAPHFVHADLSVAEFQALQAKRGESVIGFAMQAGKPAPGQAEPDVRRMMTALLAGNASALKLELVHSLGAGDDQIRGFAGENVIIGDRNARVVEVLARQLEAGRKNIGIFYGAAHFPDLEERLVKDGWKQTRQEWLTAWDIPKPMPKAKPAANEAPADPAKEAAAAPAKQAA